MIIKIQVKNNNNNKKATNTILQLLCTEIIISTNTRLRCILRYNSWAMKQ